MDRTSKTDLLTKIRSDRARQRSKLPYRKEVYTTISCIVQVHDLGEEFLRLLDNTEQHLCRLPGEPAEVERKPSLELPPFSLVSQEQYRLVASIVEKLDNPYMGFARSPEELLLSSALYRSNPRLDSEDLLHFHFRTLLQRERSRSQLTSAVPRWQEKG